MAKVFVVPDRAVVVPGVTLPPADAVTESAKVGVAAEEGSVWQRHKVAATQERKALA
jgi:hypothetical protein